MKTAALFVLALQAVGLSAQDDGCSFARVEGEILKTQRTDESWGNERTCRRRNGGSKAKHLCRFTLKCQAPKPGFPGFFFVGDYDGEGIKIICRNGKWKTVNGNKDVPSCVSGCFRLNKHAMANATFRGGEPTEIYRTEFGQELYPLDTYVETVCKPGYIFTGKHLEKNGFDKHTCNNLPGWTDLLNTDPDRDSKRGWPATCHKVCPILSYSLEEGVEVIAKAEDNKNNVREYRNGTTVLVSGSAYQFKCKDGYKPANPSYTDGKQTLQCNGDWQDPQFPDQEGKPFKCISQGCPPIKNLPTNGILETGEGCGRGQAMVDNCEVTIKCKKSDGRQSGLGYFMPNKPAGYKLKCVKGSWVQEDGRPAVPDNNGVYGGNCKPGCAGLTASDLTSTNVVKPADGVANKNDDIDFYEPRTMFTTGCKDQYVRPGLDTQPSNGEVFKCSSDGWKSTDGRQEQLNIYPNMCLAACEVPIDTVGGTDSKKGGAVTMKNGRQMMHKGSTITSSCKDKFKPPTGMPSSQVLTCEGGQSGWKDVQTGRTNENVLSCVRDGAAGCTPVLPGSGTIVVPVGNCELVDGLLPAGCKLSVKCKKGFVPDGPATVSPDGEQSLTCKAGNDGYEDSTTGVKNTTGLKCIPGCEMFELMEAAEYVVAPKAADIMTTYAGKKYLRPTAEVTVKCKPIEQGYYYNNDRDKQRAESGKPNVMYVCKGGDEKYLKTSTDSKNKLPGDCCGPVCDALADTTTNIVRNMRIPNSIEFTTNYIRRAVGVQYEVTCQRGYEFPKGSEEATRGKQHLLCVGGTKGYVDLTSNNSTNTKVTECVKSEAPRCPPIDTSLTNVEIRGINEACNPATGKFNDGCKLTVRCSEGTFPVDGYTGTSTTQDIKCTVLSNNTALWTEINIGEGVKPLECCKGCAHVKPTNAFTIVTHLTSEHIVTSGGITYYKRDAEMKIRCNEGYIPRLESNIPPEQGKQGLLFKCLAYEPETPWKNVVADYTDEGPAHICVKTCPALRASKEGVTIKNGPSEQTTSTGAIVSGGGVYTLSCKSNYLYENPAHAGNNEQRLYCDPNTGSYVDLTAGNKTSASVAQCRKIDEGCRDLPVTQGHITSDCKSGWNDGCSISIRCDEGFIPSDSKYHGSGSQKLKCKGFNWVDDSGNTVYDAMECKEACKYDPSKVNTNSKVNQMSTATITVDNQEYVVAGTSIKITCQGDGVIWLHDARDTTKEHEYKCAGGKSGFTSEVDNKINVIVGEGYVGTCVALFATSPDSTLVLKEPPRTIRHNGQELVPEGLSYVFTCAENFVYPAELFMAAETFKCNGKTRKFENPATSVPLAQPTSCVRNPKLDECPILKPDKEAVEQQVNGCAQNGEYFKSSCTVTYSCKKGYKPTVDYYNTATGRQVLTCATAGIGWKDQGERIITTALQCVPGCVSHKNLTVMGVDMHIYMITHESVLLKAHCFDDFMYNNGTNIDTSKNYYACNVTSTEYYNHFCTGACREIPASSVPAGVIKKKDAALVSLRMDYVFAKTAVTFTCQDGWSYPENSPYFARGEQVLRCMNDTNQYYDETAKYATNTVAACVQNTGCKRLTVSNGVNGPDFVNSCTTLPGDSYSDKCTLVYTCHNGYYPADDILLYEGIQKITCDAKQKSWVDQYNKPIEQLLQCNAGCRELDYVTIVKYLNSTNVNVGFQTIRDDKGDEHQCYSTTTVNEITRIVQMVQQNKSPYFCRTKDPVSNTETIEDTKNACLNTCVAIPNLYPNGVTRVKKPAQFTGPKNVDYTTTTDAYVFKCLPGFEYQAGSIESSKMEQRLRCLGNGSYFDVHAGVVTNIIKPCQKIRGCDKMPSTATTNYKYDVNCGSNSALVLNGCQVNVTCQSKAYPTQEEHRVLEGATYECQVNNLGQSVWIEKKTGKQPMFKFECTQGCRPVSEIIQGKREETKAATVTLKDTNGVIQKQVKCNKVSSSFDVSKLSETVKQYYCELRENSNGLIILPITCTGGCVLAKPQGGITVAHSPDGTRATSAWGIQIKYCQENCFPIGEVEMAKDSMTLSCPAGKKFADINSQQRVLTCRENGDFLENGQVVSTLSQCI